MNLKTILSLCVGLCVVQTVQSQFAYRTNGGTVTITGYTDLWTGVVTIPAAISGLPVTSIENFGLLGSGITSVILPGTVTNIGGSAFDEDIGLTNVTIPDSVVTIGGDAFALCRSLTNLTIPSGVTSIGSEAFYDCYSLSSVTIPDTVTNIGSGPFEGCTGLSAITVDAQNPFYSSLNGVLFNKTLTTLIQYPGGLIGSYSIPESVTNIGGAFIYCAGLTNITIPSGVTNIGSETFYDCTGLTTITVNGQNGFYSSMNGVLVNKSQTALVEFPTGLEGSYAIPDTITSIGNSAFLGCRLTSVTIANSVTNIAQQAFQDCASLTNVTIPGNVISIGTSAFSDCYRLTIAKIANGVTSIGVSAFQQCSGMTNLTISDSVTSIGDSAFDECSSLTSVTIPSSVTNIGEFAFQSCTSLTNIFFTGDAPGAESSVFAGDNHATVYYYAGTAGWGTTFSGRPALAVWPATYLINNGSIIVTGYVGPGGVVNIPTTLRAYP